jgi:hypothetical protein
MGGNENNGNNFEKIEKGKMDFLLDIHKCLQDQVTIVDAKAWGLIVLNGTLGLALIDHHPKQTLQFDFCWIAISSLVISIVLDLISIWPRLSKGSKGLIYWDDMLFWKSYSKFLSEMQLKSNEGLLEEYAKQNWNVGNILRRKY